MNIFCFISEAGSVTNTIERSIFIQTECKPANDLTISPRMSDKEGECTSCSPTLNARQ